MQSMRASRFGPPLVCLQSSAFLIHNSSFLIHNSSFLMHNSSILLQKFYDVCSRCSAGGFIHGIEAHAGHANRILEARSHLRRAHHPELVKLLILIRCFLRTGVVRSARAGAGVAPTAPTTTAVSSGFTVVHHAIVVARAGLQKSSFSYTIPRF